MGAILTVNRPILIYEKDLHLGYTLQRVFFIAGYLAKLTDNRQEFVHELQNNSYRYIIVNQQSLDWECLLILLKLPAHLINKVTLVFLVSDEINIPKIEDQANLEVKYYQLPINPEELLQDIFGQPLRDRAENFTYTTNAER